MKSKWFKWFLSLCLIFGFTSLAMAGTAKQMKYGIRFMDEGADHSTPPSGYLELFVNSDTLYVIDDSGTKTDVLAASSMAWSSLTNPTDDKTLTWDDNETTIFSFADTNEDMFTIKGVGAFGDVSIVKISQETGNATDGTVLEVVAADANVDPLVVSASGKANALVVGQNTGVVTIAGVAEGTDTLVLTAGDLRLTDGDIDLAGGDAIFAEDLSVGGNLSVTGTTTLTGTFYTSALAPSSGNITLNAAGAGTIAIGGSSTGAISLTGGGVDIGDAATDTLTITGIIDGNVTLDDNTTDSPKLIFVDSDNEQHEFYADQDTDDLNLECANADDSLAVTVGNLSSGTPNSGVITINGGDLYVTDDAEIDGKLVVDTTGEGLDVNEDVDIDFDANDEEVNIASSVADYAADSAMVTLQNSGAGQANNHYLLRLRHNADADANDKFLVMEDNNGGTDLVDFSGGGVTTWTLDAAAYVKIDGATTTNTGTDGILDINYATATDATEGINLNVVATTGAGETLHGMYINMDDDTADTGTLRALGIGASDSTPAGGSTTVDGIAILTGIDRGITMALDAGSVGAVIDATTAASTVTTGAVMDVAFRSATTTAQGFNFDFESDVAGGAGEIVEGIHIQLDDDANSADDELRAIEIDTDGNGTGLQHAIIVEDNAGWDAGLWLKGGYLRVGTGSSPGQSLGDGDNAFFEGTVEIDGNLYPDGNIVGDGQTVTQGVSVGSETVTEANTITAAECSKVFFLNAAGGFASTLPTASTVPGGCAFDFYVYTAPSGGSYTIVTGNTSENVMYGGVVERETDTGDDGPYLAQADTITLVDSIAVKSDHVRVVGDGASWYITGQTNADGAVTVTQAD